MSAARVTPMAPFRTSKRLTPTPARSSRSTRPRPSASWPTYSPTNARADACLAPLWSHGPITGSGATPRSTDESPSRESPVVGRFPLVVRGRCSRRGQISTIATLTNQRTHRPASTVRTGLPLLVGEPAKRQSSRRGWSGDKGEPAISAITPAKRLCVRRSDARIGVLDCSTVTGNRRRLRGTARAGAGLGVRQR
jgi:hypothetical protein